MGNLLSKKLQKYLKTPSSNQDCTEVSLLTSSTKEKKSVKMAPK